MTSTPVTAASNLTNLSSNHTNVAVDCHLVFYGIRVAITVVIVILLMFSLIGNLMLVTIVYQRASMRSGINLMLANLSICDCANALINMPLTLVLFNAYHRPLGDLFCSLSGVFCFTMNTEKLATLMVISIDRYRIVVKRKDAISSMTACAFVVISWFFALIISLLPTFGWGHYNYRCNPNHCSMDFGSQGYLVRSYLIFSASFTIFTPCFVLLAAYSGIWRTVYRSRYRIENHPPVTPTAMHLKGRLYIDYGYKRRTSSTVFILSLVVILCLLPIGIFHIYIALRQGSAYFPYSIYLVSVSYLHGVINPIIYYNRIKKYRERLYEIWPRICTFSYWISCRSRRRIKPHATYQVSKSDVTIYCISIP